MTLASVWAGRPHITELVVIRPVVNLPLRRERLREANTASQPAAAKASDAFSIEHVSVSGGTIMFSNLRDRVENRIETVNADISIDADRKIQLSGNARSNGNPLKFEIKAAPPAAPIERQNIPAEIRIDAPGLLHAPLAAKAEVRLNGSVVMINGVTGTLGDGAFNGWASVDLSSKPLVKLDLDFQKLAVAMSRDTGEYLRAALEQRDDRPQRPQLYRRAGAHFRGRTQHRRRALRARRDRCHAGERRIEGAGLQSRRL